MKKQIYIALLILMGTFSLSAQVSISGQITCPDGFPMGSQEVKLAGDLIADMSVNTDGNGNYVFSNLPTGGNYTITIEKTDNPLNGVSTYDLVLIAQHLLNIQPLPAPYHYLIADINYSGSITTLDLVLLRKLILFIDTEFPSGLSWYFATEDYNPSPPSGSINVAQLDNLQSSEIVNFVAVKIGDVSGGSCN